MKRHVDGNGASDGAIHDVEMANMPTSPASIKTNELLAATQPPPPSSGFHRSLGTTNATTTSTRKPRGHATSAPLIRDESIKRIGTSPVPFGSLSEAFCFAVFLVVFILATCVVGHDANAFFFANRVRAALIERDFEVSIQQGASSAQKTFTGIQDQGDVWAFLEGPFLDAVYGTSFQPSDDTDQDTTSSSSTMVLSYNTLLGGVRFRSLRVTQDTCPTLSRLPEYSALVPYCYGAFSPSIEQIKGYGPILNSQEITASLCFAFAKSFFADKTTTKDYSDLQTCYTDCGAACGDFYGVERYRYTLQCKSQCGVHCKCLYEQPAGFTTLCVDPNPNGADAALPTAVYAYNWSSSAVTGASGVTGYTHTYPGSGYVVDLPLNGTQATALLAEMKKNRFLDLATRLLVIDMTLFNGYLQLFNRVQFVMEFPPSGGVYASFSDIVVNVFQYSSSPRDTPRIVLELLLVVFIAWKWKAMVTKWYSMGIRNYFHYDLLWHGIECTHLSLFAVVIAFRLYVVDLSYGTLSGRQVTITPSSSTSELPDLYTLAKVREIDAILSSLNAAFVWLHFLKYTQMSKRMRLLLRTLHRASTDLLWFLVYFFLCIVGFAQIGFLLFGIQNAHFRTVGVGIVTLLHAIAGELDYQALVEAHQALGPIFYVAFYLLVLLIVLNVFLAIVNDAYVQTLSEQEEEDEQEEALLLRSERTLDSEGTPDANAELEAHLRRLERRELEMLRKYPFSKGLEPALKMLVADLKKSVYEMRTGRRLFKVDPVVTGMLDVLDGAASARPAGSSTGTASRKLTIQVKRQLERQMQLQESAREAKRLEQESAQRELVLSHQAELTQRLGSLVESNRDKTKRMEEMEGMLGSIEKLCQQLVTAAMEDVPASPKRPTTTAIGGGGRPMTGSTALAMALQRQKTAGRGGLSKTDGEIEEITL